MHYDASLLRYDALHFPEFLYSSDWRSARNNWRLFLRQAWKTGTFQEVLVGQRTRDIRATEGAVVFEVSSRGIDKLPQPVEKWWVSCSGDTRPYRNDDSQRDTVLRAQGLIRDGLQYLWYALGMIGKHADLPWLVGEERNDFFRNKTDVLRLVAASLADWLPELMFLSDRLSTSWDTPITEPCKDLLPEWLMKTCTTFCMSGYKMPPLNKAWADTFHLHRGDPATFLLIHGLVQRANDGRFRLASDS